MEKLSQKNTDESGEGVFEKSSPENELSPEILFNILKKIKPIDSFNTAAHSIKAPGYWESKTKIKLSDLLVKVFTEGLLGFNRGQDNKYTEKDVRSTERWKEEMLQKKPNPIFVRIVRSPEHNPERFQRIGGIQILFNIDNFKEKVNQGKDGNFASQSYNEHGVHKREFPVHSYTTGNELEHVSHKDNPDDYISIDEYIDDSDLDKYKKDGYYTGSHTAEYLLYSRVAPRFFTGILLSQEDEQNLRPVIKSMQDAYKDKPELMIPIYNHNGDMLWPQKMTYEEIVDMKKNTENQEEESSEGNKE